MVNIREANQHLSKYIRQLQTGDELVITRHGKAVAKLTPIIEKKTLSAQQSEALGRLRKLKNLIVFVSLLTMAYNKHLIEAPYAAFAVA